MMNTFILSQVVANIRLRLPELACLVLGKALLWLICSPLADEIVPGEFKREVLSEWDHVRGADVDPEMNPIKQMAVTVAGDHGAVFIDLVGAIDVDGLAGQPALGTNVTIRNQLLGMQSGLLSRRQDKQCGVKDSGQSNSIECGAVFGILNGNVRRIALQPARRRTAGGERGEGEETGAEETPERAAANNLAMMATLMPTPRRLHNLWQEYHHGVGGRKAARLFSYTERGHSKASVQSTHAW
ncbi:hypothetical protein MHU86_805 [Fragilaria crotonensis]|nr:hypothetical protein MHU86_18206 [Fragilaria crotonensis]KAI2513665.1 hypothetical protein MHU86_805 [Fragilaria crotonensis]